jgi:site-specific recombinase XerD
VQFIETFLYNGKIDWTPQLKKAKKRPLKSIYFQESIELFEAKMRKQGLKPNTMDGYRRLVHYFLSYLEDRFYSSLDQIRSGDVISFISMICQEHYKSSSLSAHLPGLKLFLLMSETTKKLVMELPERLPKKHNIIKVYSDAELKNLKQYITNSDLSLRDKAICLLSMETGLRAIDICNIRLKDINWKHDIINIIQEKTGKKLDIPLKASFGNAIVDYLIEERPHSNSDHVFLQAQAPFDPLLSHSGYRAILKKMVKNAGLTEDERSYGTRIMRHSVASQMLHHGVPLPVISEALGHTDPNSSMIYISTDDITLAGLTLPLPIIEVASHE